MSTETRSRALVLGGGGVTGVAWMTGLFLGLEEEGVDLGSIDLYVGTSAGSVVAAQLATGISLKDLFRRQVDPTLAAPELAPRIPYLRILAHVLPALLARKDATTFRQRIGRMALSAKTVAPAERRAVIEARLPRQDWPEADLAISAIDAHSGELVWFEASSRVSLVDAVGASCAVPGVWPPVRIGERTFYDGGIPSPDNAVRAAGFASVLIVSPTGVDRSGGVARRVQREAAALEGGGSRVTIVTPDAESRASIGRRALDPRYRTPAAGAGHAQGRTLAARVRESWA
jgi:NTE family protein